MNLGRNIPTELRAPVRFEPQPARVREKPLRLWLADDSREVRTLLARLLARDGQIECARQFSSAKALLEALAQETENPPEAILMDADMPGMNGVDAIRPAREMARFTHVFIMTTFYDGDLAARAFNAGASGFFLKRQELERTIESILEVSAEPVPRILAASAPRRPAVEANGSGRRGPTQVPPSRPIPLIARALGAIRALLFL
jgi:DNA-binding NarL/FixJ family response regulator